MTVRITSRMGHFNIADRRQEECQVSLATPYGNVSVLFDENVGDLSDQSVEDVLDMIEHRLGQYLIHTRRDEYRAIIAKIRENLAECELMFAEAELAACERRYESARKALELKRATVAMLREEAGQ